ncbi:MAG: hybrid sensor histidine kinase/response regulator [Pyrinomonadaceae bacterium]
MSLDVTSATITQNITTFDVPRVIESEKERILVVDDSATVRRMFSKCLEYQYECLEAESVQDALTLLRHTEFALVITDIIMPGMSGIELLRKIIETYPDTAVIVVSGVDRPQRALDAVRLGAFDYLIKPCDLDVLELTVERALERRTLLNNAQRYKADLEARNNELVSGKLQLERLQEQIVHSEKMASLGQLAAGVAHELNNPVGFIYGNLDSLRNTVEDLKELVDFYEAIDVNPDTAAAAAALKDKIDYPASMDDLYSIISDCREGAERIRDIVQNLRTFSRLDEAEFKKSDIHEGIDSTIRLLSQYFTGGNISLKREYGNIPQVEAFGGQINQVWMNLLVNAAQSVSAAGGGGEVRVTTYTENENVIVSVSDTGTGIAPEHLSRIFDPFYTTKPVGDGTGLGLSISFGIVKRHNGTITVKTEVNEGTTFTVKLPITHTDVPTDMTGDENSDYRMN